MNEQLKKARLARDWMQFEVGDILNVDHRTYRRWELGGTRPSPHNLQKLCELFGMTAKELGFEVKL